MPCRTRTKVTLLLGPARSGKTEKLLGRYRKQLQDGKINTALWLAPTWQAVRHVEKRLLNGGLTAAFSPNIMTFAQFARLLIDSGEQVFRAISDAEKQLIVELLLQQLEHEAQLEQFAAVTGTPGFIDRICRWLSELKRADIWPEKFRELCVNFRNENKYRELLQIYERYQALLSKQQLYDAEGCFWLARELLKQGHLGPFGELELIVVDGFTDFTPPQHQILELLVQKLEKLRELWITLPDDHQSGRDDLFAKPRKTAKELQKSLKASKKYMEAGPSHLPEDLKHLERYLFTSPRRYPKQNIPEPEHIEILAASSQRGEIEQVARRIKRLLLCGDEKNGRRVLPNEIAVVVRNTQQLAGLIEEVFTQAGIPIAMRFGRPLAQSRLLATVFDLLRLKEEKWSFRRLRALLANNLFAPRWTDCQDDNLRRYLLRLLYELKVSAGRDKLVQAIGKKLEWPQENVEQYVEVYSEYFQKQQENFDLEKRQSASNDDSADVCDHRSLSLPIEESNLLPGGEPRHQAARMLLRLTAFYKAIPESAAFEKWLQILAWITYEVGLTEWLISQQQCAVELPGCGQVSESQAEVARRCVLFELLAWDRFWNSAKKRASFHSGIAGNHRELTLQDFLQQLRLIVAQEQVIVPAQCPEGSVQIITPGEARNIQVPYLFLVGLAEETFPVPEPQGEIISPTEREELVRQGANIPLRGERAIHEMLLFYELVTRAGKFLWLSYPAIDERAEPLLPSPFLREVQAIFGDKLKCEQSFSELSPVVQDEAITLDQLRLKVFARILSGQTADNSAGLSHLARVGQRVAESLRILDQRLNRQFTAADGKLNQEEIIRQLRRQFGPSCTFSASSLEAYAQCPFKYFLEKVLKIDALEEPELAFDYALQGVVLHRLIAKLQRTLQKNFPQQLPHQICESDFKELVRKLADEERQILEQKGVDEASIAAFLRLWDAWSTQYQQEYQAYLEILERDEGFSHQLLEVTFGSAPDDEAIGEEEQFRALKLEHNGNTYLISGRIDRIDISQSGRVAKFVVIDYKTGNPGGSVNKDNVCSGKSLQLPLYALAIRDVILKNKAAQPLALVYWKITDNINKPLLEPPKPAKAIIRLKIDDNKQEEWEQIETAVRETVAKFVESIRSGTFVPAPLEDATCNRCDYRTVCRVNFLQQLGKNWSWETASD